MEKKRVLLGMSGGVDSSVAAILLQQQGYEVIGCTMQLWEPKQQACEKQEEKKDLCCENQAIKEAQKVCKKLKIPHITIDCKKQFEEKVVKPFVQEYKEARTPNPCIECNHYLKFGVFYEKAKELGCDFLATGHYASIIFSEKYQQYVLKKAEEEKKDQSYFLYTITKEILPHILFPLQNYTNKEEIRKIAQENGLTVATKKDSQEICFIPDNDYQRFLKQEGKLVNQKGKIVFKKQKVLGEHQGLINYTIGQRKGLGISYLKPLYVIALDKKKNEVVVGLEEELYQQELYAKDVNWMISFEKEDKIVCKAKIRYRSKEADCTVYPKEDKVKVVFKEPQRAITSGQSVVFYDLQGVVLGGGKID